MQTLVRNFLMLPLSRNVPTVLLTNPNNVPTTAILVGTPRSRLGRNVDESDKPRGHSHPAMVRSRNIIRNCIRYLPIYYFLLCIDKKYWQLEKILWRRYVDDILISSGEWPHRLGIERESRLWRNRASTYHTNDDRLYKDLRYDPS